MESVLGKAIKLGESSQREGQSFVPILGAYLISYFGNQETYQKYVDSVSKKKKEDMSEFENHFSSFCSNRAKYRDSFLQYVAELSKHLELLGRLR